MHGRRWSERESSHVRSIDAEVQKTKAVRSEKGTMEPIAEWLEKLGLGQYGRRFVKNGIDIAALAHLTDQDFKDLGVLLGHRRRMQAAIAELAGAAPVESRPAALHQPAPRDNAERRQVTVMFTDLVGSTALSTKLDPEDLRSVIGAYHKCVAETVARFDGFVAKYMGDGVLIYFGYPQAHEDDAERAARAGLALIEAVQNLRTEEPLQVRIGVAAGLVVVGDLVGSGEAQERGIVGETPNLAARLQAFAAPGTIVIGPRTRLLLGGLFEYTDLGEVELKGFAAPVHIWQVVGPSAVESRFEALRKTTTPLVGRDEEVELLLRRWEQAKRGEGAVVLISGEPGIGKSRLAQTIVERLSGEPHTRLRYFCSPHHRDSALYPTIAQLERAAGFRREDSDEQRLDKLEGLLAQGTNDVREAAPLLAALLSISPGKRYPPLTLSPQKRKERTLHALRAQAEGLATQQPLLMVFEDLHWSDPTTRELLDLIIDRTSAIPILVILTFRPEFIPPWVGRPQITFLSLNRLPVRERALMITNLMGGKTLPKDIADQIIDRTDGVPLFVEELTKTVVESGILSEVGDRYAASAPVAQLAIPTTLQASLLARLDRIAPTREVAQVGAALGRQFSYELISAVAPVSGQQLDDALSQLAAAELIFCRGTPPDAEYTFKHALVRDVTYETMLRSHRLQLHARIANVLENVFPETATTAPEILAQHCIAAGIATQAIPYCLRAGQNELQRSALTEATNHLTKGLELLSGIEDEKVRAGRELELQATLALALTAAKGYAAPEVERAYGRARALCDQIGDAPQLFPVLYGLFVFHWIRGHMQTARENAEALLSIAERERDSALLLIAHSSLGCVDYHIGNNRTALDHLVKARALYDEKTHASLAVAYGQDLGVLTLCYMDFVQLSLGHYDESLQAGSEAIALARRLGHPLSLCLALACRAFSTINYRDPAATLRLTEECISIAQEKGIAHWLAMAMIYRGWALAQIGSVDDGITQICQGIDAWHAMGAGVALGLFFSVLAESHIAGRQTTEAIGATDQALAWIEKNSEGRWENLVRCCRGNVFRTLHDPDRAAAEYEKALLVARQHEAKGGELRAAIHLAKLWRDQGKGAEARDLIAPIYGWFTEGVDWRDLKDAKALLDELT
jgi:predicted ATPase/class 3 adenylate cyclase